MLALPAVLVVAGVWRGSGSRPTPRPGPGWLAALGVLGAELSYSRHAPSKDSQNRCDYVLGHRIP